MQRTMLVYIGWKVFLDHPVAGAGWQASNDEYVYAPFLPRPAREVPEHAAAGLPVARAPVRHPERVRPGARRPRRRRARALPRRARTPLALAVRRLLRGPPPEAALLAAMWLLVTMGVLTAVGLVAGIPTDALLWIAAGLCVAPIALAAEA